jgi:hypothetical protein
VKAYFEKNFPTFADAFQAMDKSGKGKLTLEDVKAGMAGMGNLQPLDAVTTFYFMDRDHHGFVTEKEIQNFMTFERELFETDLEETRKYFANMFSTVPDSYMALGWKGAFCTGERKTMMPTAVQVGLAEFEKGFNRLVVSLSAETEPLNVSFDGRALFHFLDSGHLRSISMQEWTSMQHLPQVPDCEKALKFTQESIDHFVHFFRTQYSSFEEAYQALLDAISD